MSTTTVEDRVPDTLVEKHLEFKTTTFILGALLLALASILRPEYPILWILFFIAGVLVEGLAIVTNYVVVNQLETEINQARSEINRARSEISDNVDNVEEIQREIKQTKNDIFEGFHGSQSTRQSIERRVSELEEKMGTTNRHHTQDNLERRVSDIEDDFRDLKRTLRGR